MRELTEEEKKAIEISEKLYQEAINRYLDKSDFDCCEWLSEKEKKQYIEARKILNEWD